MRSACLRLAEKHSSSTSIVSSWDSSDVLFSNVQLPTHSSSPRVTNSSSRVN
jgi:hypothetical protein